MRKFFLVGASISLIFLGCNNKPNESDLVKHMTVVTNYIDTVNFSKKTTYWLATDTLSYFDSSDSDPADTLQCVKCTGYNNSLGDYANAITSEVKAKLDAAGYVQVTKNQNPDMKVYVAIVRNYNVYQSYSYYPYGYGYGYGYYGGYYGGSYYPTYSVSDIADLYLIIFDLKHLYKGTPNQIWFTDIGDLISSQDLFGKTLESIDQAFKQSPYLKK